MKKIVFILFLIPVMANSQNLDTVTVNLTLKSGDWAFLAGTIRQNDSALFSTFRRIRDTIRLANPSNFNTNVRVNALPGNFVYLVYINIKEQSVTLYEQIGLNINNQIKAISNTTLQSFLTAFDNIAAILYLSRRTLGKNIIMDN